MLKDVFRAAFWLRNIYLMCFEWRKSKQMLMMRQRIFAPNFVIFGVQMLIQSMNR